MYNYGKGINGWLVLSILACHPRKKFVRLETLDADQRRYRGKMELLGYSEDRLCHLEQKGAHSSGDVAGLD